MPITPMSPFKGRQYPGEVILQAVRWYLRYPLAYRHALPPASEDDEQELPFRRDLHKGQRQRPIPVPGS
jgi:hypothetical protein